VIFLKTFVVRAILEVKPYEISPNSCGLLKAMALGTLQQSTSGVTEMTLNQLLYAYYSKYYILLDIVQILLHLNTIIFVPFD
jgi:hypothetical protein